MKGSIKMEDYDGYLERFTKEHRTKILPLRWIANLCEIPAHYHLERFLRCDDLNIRGFIYRYHAYMSNLWYKPYMRWGTVYKLDLDDPKIMNKAWDKE
jgi:hypothetical protein